MKFKKGHVYRCSEDGEEYVVLRTPGTNEYWFQIYKLSASPGLPDHIHVCSAEGQFTPTGKKVDMLDRVGGTPVVVYDGRLYMGCTRFGPCKADALFARVGKALGWEIER